MDEREMTIILKSINRLSEFFFNTQAFCRHIKLSSKERKVATTTT